MFVLFLFPVVSSFLISSPYVVKIENFQEFTILDTSLCDLDYKSYSLVSSVKFIDASYYYHDYFLGFIINKHAIGVSKTTLETSVVETDELVNRKLVHSYDILHKDTLSLDVFNKLGCISLVFSGENLKKEARRAVSLSVNSLKKSELVLTFFEQFDRSFTFQGFEAEIDKNSKILKYSCIYPSTHGDLTHHDPVFMNLLLNVVADLDNRTVLEIGEEIVFNVFLICIFCSVFN
jgi:hypothetical protein